MPATLFSPAVREPEGTLLGSRPAALTLRVCGGSHRDRLVRIQAAKCTVGSATGCTLRLRAEGVAPLHCWILRGPRGAVIRRATGYTLLNGHTYQDSPLATGDRLIVGSVELEVVNCPAAIAESVHTATAVGSSAPLEASLAAANDEIARLKSDAQQAWQTSIVASERAEQMCEALERANVELGEIRAELEVAQAALNRRPDSRQFDPRQLEEQRARCKQLEELLYESQRELGSTREGLQQALGSVQERTTLVDRLHADCAGRDQRIAVLERELAEAVQAARGPATVAMCDVQAELAEQRQLQDQLAALEREVSQLQSELHTERQAAQRLRDDAAALTNELSHSQQQVQHWQAEAARHAQQGESLQSQVGVLEQQLQESRSAGEGLQRQVAELQRQIEPLQAEADQARMRQAELDGRAAELATREASCEARQQSLAVRQTELDATQQQQAEREAFLSDKDVALARQAQALQEEQERTAQRQAELGELKSHLNGLSADESARQKQLDDLAAELAARSENLDEREARLSRRHQDLEEQHAAWQAERAEQDRATAANAAAGDANALEPNLDLPPSGRQSESDQDDHGHVESVLGRLVKAGLWRDDQAEASSGPVEGPSSSAGPSDPSPHESSRDNAQPQTGAHHEEESIESYMERLMNRMRPSGDKSSAGKAASGPAASALVQPSGQQAETAASDTADPEPSAPPEYLPRSSAKELSGDLTAMRELANSAARSAIAEHQQKHLQKKHTRRSLKGGTLMVLSCLAIVLWAWWFGSLVSLLAAVCGLAIAGVWGLLALRRLVNGLRLQRPATGAVMGEPAAVDAAAPEVDPSENPT